MSHTFELAPGAPAGRLQAFDLLLGVASAFAGKCRGEPAAHIDDVCSSFGDPGRDALPAEDH
jgi:hypothetical protein